MLELREIIFKNIRIINDSFVLTLNNFPYETPKVLMFKGILGKIGTEMER